MSVWSGRCVLLLYGDILSIVENWPSQFFISMIELIHWILYWKISIDLIGDMVNVIQQKSLEFIMRRKFKAPEKIRRVDTLLIWRTLEEKSSDVLLSSNHFHYLFFSYYYYQLSIV